MSVENVNLTRRGLLRAASLGALSLGATAAGGQEKAEALKPDAPKTEDRNSNKSLPRRRLGRTNMMVTTIGSGGAGITGPEILHRAIDKGINYIDTAPAYGDSEDVFGEVMKTDRDKVFLATKWVVLGDWTMEQCLESLNRSLKKLKTDHVDLLQMHSVDTGPGIKGTPRDGYVRIDNPNLHKAMEKARKDGKVRWFGVSSHNPQRKDLLKYAIDTGLFDAILVAFNHLNFEQSGMPELLAHAHKKDIGVIGMKASAGNATLNVPNVKPLTAQLAWILSKDIQTVINSKTVFNEDLQDACLAAAKIKLAQADRDTLERYAAAVHSDYCRGCGHLCESACPADVRIADILRFEMYHRNYGGAHQELARTSYAELATDERVLHSCHDCRKCEEACPYTLPIVDKLHYVERELA